MSCANICTPFEEKEMELWVRLQRREKAGGRELRHFLCLGLQDAKDHLHPSDPRTTSSGVPKYPPPCTCPTSSLGLQGFKHLWFWQLSNHKKVLKRRVLVVDPHQGGLRGIVFSGVITQEKLAGSWAPGILNKEKGCDRLSVGGYTPASLGLFGACAE